MLLSLILLFGSIFLVIKSADFAIHFSKRLSKSFGLSDYLVGFIVVAIISILPETFISVTSALEGEPSFGLGTLFGSNVADLSLVMALVVLLSGRNLIVESKVIKNRFLHIGILLIPLIFGSNGYYSRWEGILLIVLGMGFYYLMLRKNQYGVEKIKEKFSFSNVFFLLLSMAVLLLGADLTVKYSINLANFLQINPLFIGMFIVGLGTTLPELFFSVRAAKKKDEGLALGDILGTVIADATIVVGIIAIISPFAFNRRIVFITGIFMMVAMVILFRFMKTGKVLSKKEAVLLLLFYIIFVLTESYTSNLF